MRSLPNILKSLSALTFFTVNTSGVRAEPPDTSSPPVQLWVKFNHQFGESRLHLNDVSNRTPPPANQTISITRLSYLVSNVHLVRDDGTKSGGIDGAAFISASEDRDSFEVQGVARGTYSGIEFDIGLDPTLNHSDPAKYAPDHALNPLINGLHWGWQGGYVFLAIEGRYQLPGDELGGYSFHIGNDPQLMHIALKRAIDVSDDRLITLNFDVSRIFGGPSKGPGGKVQDEQSGIIKIDHAADTDSTHSGEGDPLAPRLAANIKAAWSISGVAALNAPLHIAETEIAAPPRGTTAYELKLPAHFPQVRLPTDNPLTKEGVALGERIFFDPVLSANNAQSCASCHQRSAAFSDGGKKLSTGIDGLEGKRNAMPLFNLAWSRSMTWDGKRARIRDQVVAPIQDEKEMHQSLDGAVAKLGASAEYPALFERAFGSPGITAQRLALALEQYLLTLISADSKFDKALRKEVELTAQEQRGLLLFITEYDPSRGKLGADCFHCHGGNLFTDGEFKNNGLDSIFPDAGRGEVTGRPSDTGKFKVPSLRNIAVSGPYMHDGRFATLEEAIGHYSGGVKRTDTLDPNLAKHPDGGVVIQPEDQTALAAFLRTLTDEQFIAQGAKPPPGAK